MRGTVKPHSPFSAEDDARKLRTAMKGLGLYSGTSDKTHSEIGMTSLQRTLVSTPCPNPHLSVLFDLRDRDNLSTRDNIFRPIVSLVRRFHCMYIQLNLRRGFSK